MERLRTALDPLRLGGANEAMAQRMEAEDTEDIDEDEESEAEEDLHLDMDEGDANSKTKVSRYLILLYTIYLRNKFLCLL